MNTKTREEIVLSSGQASGATQVPLSTIRRYVAEFPDQFSKQARIKSRGRRYTSRDIQTIMTIRKLYRDGLTHEAVRKILDRRDIEPNPDYRSRQDVADAVRVVQYANDDLAESRKLKRNVEYKVSQYRDEVRELSRKYSFWYDEYGEKVNQHEKRINHLSYQLYESKQEIILISIGVWLGMWVSFQVGGAIINWLF